MRRALLRAKVKTVRCSKRAGQVFDRTGEERFDLDFVACVQTSPLPQKKSGEELPIFCEGGRTSVHTLRFCRANIVNGQAFKCGSE